MTGVSAWMAAVSGGMTADAICITSEMMGVRKLMIGGSIAFAMLASSGTMPDSADMSGGMTAVAKFDSAGPREVVSICIAGAMELTSPWMPEETAGMTACRVVAMPEMTGPNADLSWPTMLITPCMAPCIWLVSMVGSWMPMLPSAPTAAFHAPAKAPGSDDASD